MIYERFFGFYVVVLSFVSVLLKDSETFSVSVKDSYCGRKDTGFASPIHRGYGSRWPQKGRSSCCH